jgi:hypothetical protein
MDGPSALLDLARLEPREYSSLEMGSCEGYAYQNLLEASVFNKIKRSTIRTSHCLHTLLKCRTSFVLSQEKMNNK